MDNRNRFGFDDVDDSRYAAPVLIELGPFSSSEVHQWSRFARRIVCEFGVDPAELAGIATPDLLTEWRLLIDAWDHQANGTELFRWSGELDVEMSEFLLHGLERIVCSEALLQRATLAELDRHGAFTIHVVQSFVDALAAQGHCHRHYVDQIRGSIGELLDH